MRASVLATGSLLELVLTATGSLLELVLTGRMLSVHRDDRLSRIAKARTLLAMPESLVV